MKLIQKFGICIMLLLVFMLNVDFVYGFGVLPASKQVTSTNVESFELKILNNELQKFDAYIDIQGDLAKYITLSKEKVSFTKTKDIERVTVTINIPKSVSLKEGLHENFIIIRQEASGDSQIEATINLAFRLDVMVPYSDEALEVKLFATNFEKGKQNNFILEIKNMGTKQVNQAIPLVEIYSSTNSKLDTLNLDKISIAPGEKKMIDVPWTPDLPNGKYFAKGFVIYGDKTADTQKQFSIGSPEINVDSISTYSFKLGGIASLDIIISSNWVESILDVFADVELLKGTTAVFSTKTASKDVSSLAKTNLPVYLDTAGLEPGKYNLVVKLHFLDMTKTETFELFLEQDKISLLGGSGRVVDNTTPGSEGTGMTLLIVLVLIVVIMNGFIIFKFIVKKKK